jgi:hypothetical protein
MRRTNMIRRAAHRSLATEAARAAPAASLSPQFGLLLSSALHSVLSISTRSIQLACPSAPLSAAAPSRLPPPGSCPKDPSSHSGRRRTPPAPAALPRFQQDTGYS